MLILRAEVVKYFRLTKAAMNTEDGSIFVLDIMGGHAAESSVRLQRQNEVTGAPMALPGLSHCSLQPPLHQIL